MQPQDRGPIGPAADVWGLGTTIYRALTATRPFPGEPRTYPQLNTEPEPLPARVPAPLGELVLSCLEKDPAARPSPLEIAGALEPALAALPSRPALGRRRPKLR